ncbi:hypothetical protein ACLOJK_031288 [Asimina triloba]
MFREEGLLDEQFAQLQMLQDANNPGFVAEVVALFCEDSERILGELTKYLDQTVLDYKTINAYVHQLKGSSSREASIGVWVLIMLNLPALIFVNFVRKTTEMDTKIFHRVSKMLMALNTVKHEYYNLRNKFETVVQLEQRIQAYESKQQ